MGSRRRIIKPHWRREGEIVIRVWDNGAESRFCKKSLQMALKNLHFGLSQAKKDDRGFWARQIAIYDEGMALFSSRKLIKKTFSEEK